MTSKIPKSSIAGVTDRPVDTLNNEFAKVYTHLHPFLVLSLFFSQFNALVQDPVSSLTTTLPIICALQALYIIICVPLSTAARTVASSVTQSAATQAPRRKPAAKSAPTTPIPSRIAPAILSTILSLCAATPVLTALLILHGAPLTTHLPHTALTAAHFAALSAIPLFYAHGVEGRKWRAIVSLALPLDEVLGAAVGVFVGAWVGAIPIPLDWDREWQRWPVTVVTGGYGGWAIGKLFGTYLFRGSLVRFED